MLESVCRVRLIDQWLMSERCCGADEQKLRRNAKEIGDKEK